MSRWSDERKEGTEGREEGREEKKGREEERLEG